MTQIVVATFYQFTDFHDFREWREPLLNVCNEQGIRGTILIAEEGINATIAGTREGIERVLAFLKADDRFATMLHKESFTDTIPFDRMKVRLKKEIVTLGVPSVDPTRQVGTYVPARDWNDLISSPDVILIDTRNDFECDVGTFHGALNPHTESFGEFPEYVKQHLDPAAKPKVAMFCTGGIRCEKATSWMLSQGFEEVYHLEGGILKYLEDVPPEESLWEGECFVFDERVTLDHHLQRGSYRFCEECNQLIPADAETCPHCADTGS